MKSNVKTSLYFSAYPLKAIKANEPSSAPESPYLKSVLAGRIRIHSKVRVFPMINPYPKPKTDSGPVKPIKDIGINGDEWFCNYE